GAGLDGEANAPVFGAPAQLADGADEGRTRRGVGLGRNPADAGEHQGGADVVGELERAGGAVESAVELVARIERTTGGQVQGDQREIDRSQQVAKRAPASL